MSSVQWYSHTLSQLILQHSGKVSKNYLPYTAGEGSGKAEAEIKQPHVDVTLHCSLVHHEWAWPPPARSIHGKPFR